MKYYIIFTSLLYSLLLTGCVTHTNSPIDNGVKLEVIEDQHIQETLIFLQIFFKETTEIQKIKIEASNRALSINPNNLHHRIKLAVMLFVANKPLQNTIKANKILKNLLQDNTLNPEDAAFVSLLNAYSELLNKKHTEIKRAHTKQDVLLDRNQALQKQLDNLKSIEKSMIERSTNPDSKTNAKP